MLKIPKKKPVPTFDETLAMLLRSADAAKHEAPPAEPTTHKEN